MFFGGKSKNSFASDDKDFSHVKIACWVDHFVNPFMAINLITWNELSLSKCEELRFCVAKAREKSCKNPLEMAVLLVRNHFLFLSYLNFEALEIFINNSLQSITKTHYIIMRVISVGTVFCSHWTREQFLKISEIFSRDNYYWGKWSEEAEFVHLWLIWEVFWVIWISGDEVLKI